MRLLLVDIQILQTPAYDRGMGKYTLSLLEAMITRNITEKKYDHIELILNKNLDTSKQRISAITSRLHNVRLSTFDLPTDISTGLEEKYAKARDILTGYVDKISDKYDSIDYLITAPFFVGFASEFPDQHKVGKYTIVYDLIPQKIWHLQRIFPDNIYFFHYKLLLEATHLFTISNAVRDDLVEMIGVSPKKITSIDGGPFKRPQAKNRSTGWKQGTHPYVLMPSAPIVHKNNERAVKAFAIFNDRHNSSYDLYITSTFDKDTKRRLNSLAGNIIFTGNISDEELDDAYRSASAVLFPSLAEGLGMPVLEAALYDVPVACSDIPVLSELSTEAFYQFDPTNQNSIADALERAVNKVDWETKISAYKKMTAKYTWSRSADILLKQITKPLTKKKQNKNKIQMIIPKPDHDSPAGFLSEHLYSLLSETSAIELAFHTKGSVNTGSYVAQLPESDQSASAKIRIENRRDKFLKFRRSKKRVEISVVSDSNSRVLTLLAEPYLIDKALQLKGWRYLDSKKSPLDISEIGLKINALLEGVN